MSPEKLVFDFSKPAILNLKLSGDWRIISGVPPVGNVIAQLKNHPKIEKIVFEFSGKIQWDSGLILFLLQLIRECKHRNILFVPDGLPEPVQKLVELSSSVAMEDETAQRKKRETHFLEMVGDRTVGAYSSLCLLCNFIGEITLAFGQLLKGQACFRRNEFLLIMQRSGVDALPLVTLISILVGVIFAFVGAIQLAVFDAQIYIAHIVGIAMVRVMGAVMAGILMAGRTGAAFAAELGIMQTNEEVDALQTLGIDPVEFLVLPRIMALTMMMPLLTLYADLMGILGGLTVSALMFGINPVEYLDHTQQAVKLNNLWIGLINSFVFGIIVAVSGCFYGMKCERSAAGVGQATTASVVSAITWIVIATAVITFISQIFGV
jgi:phospholipid/cholesterol/gamma-HCH transport system permease protein